MPTRVHGKTSSAKELRSLFETGFNKMYGQGQVYVDLGKELSNDWQEIKVGFKQFLSLLTKSMERREGAQ